MTYHNATTEAHEVVAELLRAARKAQEMSREALARGDDAAAKEYAERARAQTEAADNIDRFHLSYAWHTEAQ